MQSKYCITNYTHVTFMYSTWPRLMLLCRKYKLHCKIYSPSQKFLRKSAGDHGSLLKDSIKKRDQYNFFFFLTSKENENEWEKISIFSLLNCFKKAISTLKKQKLAHDMWKIVKNDQPIYEKKLTN